MFQILAQFNIDPIYIPRSYEESRTLLSQQPCMPETELPQKLREVLRQMATKTKMDEFREVIRVHCNNPATVKALKKRVTEYPNRDQVELF